MQIGLIILAPLRKRSKNPVLKFTLWLLYLTADSVAILALGNISNQADPAETGDSGTMPGKLTVLWAPFLLVHLGGPDSITSYSVEDNELWWRHLLGLLVQVVVTVYVFWQSPPKGLMWIPTMLVFIPGLIKFAERTHALRLGSEDNLKDKIISELIPGKDIGKIVPESDSNGEVNNNQQAVPAIETEGEIVPESVRNGQGDGNGEVNNNHQAVPAIETEGKIVSESTRNSQGDSNGETNNNQSDTSISQHQTVPAIKAKELTKSEKESLDICEGYQWFNQFKRLLVDVTFPSNLLMQSQDRFSEMEARDALNMVAIELSFMYDILHTKAVHMHNNVGRVLRCFSLVSIIVALIVFLHLDRKKYASKDIIITYILFGVGLILEVIAAVLLISSDWAVVSLRKKGWRKCFADAITSMVKGIFRKGKNRWSRNIGQFSLVGLCLRDRYTPRSWIMKKLIKIKHKWDNMRESTSIHLLPGMLENIMFTEAKRRAQNVHIYNVLKEARSYRGGKALERHGKLTILEWSMKMEFDESIILWHVATDICYYKELTTNQSKRKIWDNTERDVSWKTSNYMIYLLTQQQSMMQLGYGKTRFEATCAVVKKKFKGRKLEQKEAREELMKEEVTPPVLGQTDARVEEDMGSQATNQMGTLGLKNIWACLRCWGRRKDKKDKLKVEEDLGESLLKKCIQLAEELEKLEPEIKWKLISETWMEMLGYAAIHCDSYQHAKSLRRGGELLTHLWLLMSQLGVVEEHKMQQYQSGSV